MHAELVDQAKRGDREAFDSLARLTGDGCMAIAFRILRDHDLADDAVQSALLTAWREIRTPARPQALRALAPPDPDKRVLLRGQASHALVGGDPAHAGRACARARRVPGSRQPRSVRACLPTAHRRAARGPCLPPLPRPPIAGGRGSNRHSRRDRQVPHAPRQTRAPGHPRGRRSGIHGIGGANCMTEHHDLDRQLNAFLLDGPTSLPDSSFDAVRDRTEQTRQRVVLGPWRVPTLNKLIPVGLGAAALVAVLFLGSRFIGSPSSNVGGPAEAAAGVRPRPPRRRHGGPASAAPSPVSAPPLTQSFTSPLHGISLSYPEGWTARAATEPWTDGPNSHSSYDPQADHLYDPTLTGPPVPEHRLAADRRLHARGLDRGADGGMGAIGNARQPSRSPWARRPD